MDLRHYKLVICVMACATEPAYKNEILTIEKTWGERALKLGVKVLYFLGEEQTDLQDETKYIYIPNVGNDYNSALDKQNMGLKYIQDNHSYEYIFTCGTDTYINVDLLFSYINNYDSNNALYIGGHGDVRTMNNKSYYYHCGGAGFIISKPALTAIYPKLNDIKEEWSIICCESGRNDLIPACDVALSYYLQTIIGPELQIIENKDVFFSCNYKGIVHHKGVGLFMCCDKFIKHETLISCHCMTSEDFTDFTQILKENNYFSTAVIVENETLDLVPPVEVLEKYINPFEIYVPDKDSYTNDELVDVQLKLENKREEVINLINNKYPHGDSNYGFSLETVTNRCSKGVNQKLIDRENNIYPSKILYKIGNGGNNKECFVCCTPLSNNRESVSKNIHQSLESVGFNGHFYLFNGGFPTPRGCEMKYAAVPYCFKIFMMLEAEKLGFEKIIWIDAACYAVNNPQRLFDILNENDTIFRQFWPYSPGIPTYESSVFNETINVINNITKGNLTNSVNMCSVVFGLNIKSETIQNFINEYYEMVKIGTPFLSQFPEEVVMSAILNKDEYRHLFYGRGESHMLFIHEDYMCNNYEIAKNHGYYFVQRRY